MSDLDSIAHQFKLKYGCAPGEPTREQVRTILNKAAEIESSNGRQVTEDEIRKIVFEVVPSAGTYKYAAQSYQNMRDLLLQAQSLLRK